MSLGNYLNNMANGLPIDTKEGDAGHVDNLRLTNSGPITFVDFLLKHSISLTAMDDLV